jgi:subtilisin family serine protease
MKYKKQTIFLLVMVSLSTLPRLSFGQGMSTEKFLRASSDSIPNQYIVVLKPETAASRVKARASDLVGAYGGEVMFVYKYALKGFAVRATESSAQAISMDPRVKYVEEDSRVSAITTQQNPPSWGLDRIDQRNLPLNAAYSYLQTGNGVKVYVIDTGIRFTHVDFGGRALLGFDVQGGNGSDCFGHGTHVAGTIGGTSYGVAKNVTLYSVRVLGCDGSGSTAQVVLGIDWVTGHHGSPAVANLSLGGPGNQSEDDALRAMINSGVVAVVAAGNGTNNNGVATDAGQFSPARVTEALTVGATDITDVRASFSNYGTVLDAFGPGLNITSDYNSNDTATATLSGTSMATPHVAGVVARYREANPTDTPLMISQWLSAVATPGIVVDPGPGSPNKLLFAPYNMAPTIQRPTTDVAASGPSFLCYAGATFPSSGPMPYAWDSSDTTASSVDTSFTYATNIPVGYGRAFKAWPVASGSYSFLRLRVKSGCSNQSQTYPTGCAISYSPDNGVTWSNVYSTHLNRGTVTDTVVLPASQDLTKLQVYACVSGEIVTNPANFRVFPSFSVYDIRIEGY